MSTSSVQRSRFETNRNFWNFQHRFRENGCLPFPLCERYIGLQFSRRRGAIIVQLTTMPTTVLLTRQQKKSRLQKHQACSLLRGREIEKRGFSICRHCMRRMKRCSASSRLWIFTNSHQPSLEEEDEEVEYTNNTDNDGEECWIRKEHGL